MTADRDALLNDLKVVLRKHMQSGMAKVEIQSIHLDAIEWMAFCLVLRGDTSEMKIRMAVHRGAAGARKMIQQARQ